MTEPILPPGPRSRTFQSLSYLLDPYGHYARVRRRYGDLVTMPTLSGTVVLGCTPEYARQILAGSQEDFETGFGVEVLTPVVGADSLLLLSGDRHRRERKLMSPAFHGARMRAYGPLVQRTTLEVISDWRAGTRLTALPEMQRIGLDVILGAVFGVSDPADLAEFRQAVRLAVSNPNPAPLFLPFLQHELGGVGPWARFLQRKQHVYDLLQRKIDAARAVGEPGDDVLSRLLFARYEDGSALTDVALCAQLLTLIVAGHETTATALSWALYELGRNPDWAGRLRDGIGALGPEPEAAALAALPELDAFCSETLRLHPIVAEFFRTVRSEFVLGGYVIPKGISVAGAILTIHQDPSLYPEPATFRPERFLSRRFAPYEFAAFGGGHRHCIGAAFAMNEMKIVLGTLIPQVDLQLALGRPLRVVRRNLILAPEKGVPLIVERVASNRSLVA